MGATPWPVSAAAPAQHQSSAQTEAGRGVTEVYGQADLIFQTAGKEGVVEINYNIVGGPGNRDQAE